MKWWKRRKEIKRIKAVKETLLKAQEALETIRDLTPIGEMTNTRSSVSSSDISRVQLTQMCIDLHQIIHTIDKEVDDRTRERKSLFPKDKQIEKNAMETALESAREKVLGAEEDGLSYEKLNKQMKEMQEEE